MNPRDFFAQEINRQLKAHSRQPLDEVQLLLLIADTEARTKFDSLKAYELITVTAPQDRWTMLQVYLPAILEVTILLHQIDLEMRWRDVCAKVASR